MKTFIFTFIFVIASTGSMAQTSDEDQNLETQDSFKKNIESEKEHPETEKEKLEAEEKLLEGRAEQRAIFLQQELNLSNYVSERLKKIIIKYSVQANRIIQSNVSTDEKTRNLSNIIYFQNEELKKVLTVHQFYKYKKLKRS